MVKEEYETEEYKSTILKEECNTTDIKEEYNPTVVKEECNIIAESQTGTISMADHSSAIHLGPILTQDCNETISIVIPISAQLAALSRSTTGQYQQQVLCKQESIDNTDKKPAHKRSKINPPNRIKEDKTKGCPYTNCSRFGRAFSRAHDLKRHVERHKQRDHKTIEVQNQVYPCLGEPLLTFQQSTTVLPSESRYQLSSSALLSLSPPAPIPTMTNTSISTIASDDDYRLEDMLLLRKGPNNIGTSEDKKTLNVASTATSLTTSSTSATSKIRCEYCSKTFKTKWTLSSHVAAHEGRFQYQCCICSKRFVRKSHYESHVRSHDAARPYVCEHCGKTFKESKHRREHLKRKHPSNRNAIQSLLDSISACVNEETASVADQAKLTIFMPINFTT